MSKRIFWETKAIIFSGELNEKLQKYLEEGWEPWFCNDHSISHMQTRTYEIGLKRIKEIKEIG